MLGPETRQLLEDTSALIVGTVGVDGEPHVARGWGLTTLPATDDAPPSIRVLLNADDAMVLENLTTTRVIAVTGGDVRTLKSSQVKGIAEAIEPATEDDRERARVYIDAFFTAVEETDGSPRALLDHLIPASYVACTVRITELFNQSPGPGAGAPLAH